MQKQEKGITLIALVITIIILIILAAIALATLTGQNGLITNTQLARCMNSYYTAREQMNLAYNSVWTQIQIETARDSTYDATTSENTADLLKIVQADLEETSGTWKSVAATSGGVIYIQYKDTSIDQGLIDGDSSPVVPLNDTYVYAKITLTAQAASIDFDITKPSDVTF